MRLQKKGPDGGMIPAQELALSEQDLSFILVKELRQLGEFRWKNLGHDDLADVVQLAT